MSSFKDVLGTHIPISDIFDIVSSYEGRREIKRERQRKARKVKRKKKAWRDRHRFAGDNFFKVIKGIKKMSITERKGKLDELKQKYPKGYAKHHKKFISRIKV